MFTGIIEETGIITAIQKSSLSSTLSIRAEVILEDTKIGDSIAVNGICLTVTACTSTSFCADIMHETWNRINQNPLQRGLVVNLERAMPANGRFGGHIVTGHIDGCGRISELKKDGSSFWFYIQAPDNILRYIIEKGSIAIDGISLTVAKVSRTNFAVSIIPHTLQHTTLLTKKMGNYVNLEVDCIGKYVEKFVTNPNVTQGLTMNFLAENGF